MLKRSMLILLWCAACGLTGPAAGAADSLLIRVEREHPDDLTRLLAGGIPVVLEMNDLLFVEGRAADLRWLDDHGYDSAVLHDDPDGSDYLLLGIRPDSDLQTVHALGQLLDQRDNWLLVRVDRGTPIEPFKHALTWVAPLPHEPLRPPRPIPDRLQQGLFEDLASFDPLVQPIVDRVQTAEIDLLWSDLTSNPPSGTRYTTNQGCRDAAAYCLNHYDSIGVPAEYQEWNPAHAPNVVATLEGALYPDDVFIIEGHLDDLPATGPAPGADDNGSGSVTVLHAADVMSCDVYKSTIKYLNVTGEEVGLLGSDAYADDAFARGENILGVLNFDMPGWEGDGIPDPENLDVSYNGPSEWLGLSFADAAQKYGTGLVVDAFYCPSLTASDHAPFWQKGWSAIIGITDNEGYCGHGGNYPDYHQSTDTIANCGDPTFFYSVVRAAVASLAELAEPFKVTARQPFYSCSSAVELVVGDRDLDTDPAVAETVVVEVWSDSEPTPELITLTERTISSIAFDGVVTTTLDPPTPGDGVLSVAPGDSVQARYLDALDCDGSLDVAYTTSTSIDCDAPLISGVAEQNVSDVSATIVWTTDEQATSVVRWGGTTPPGQTASAPGNTTSHSVVLDGLQACTVYYYSVESEDIAGNVVVDDSGGQFYHFETLGDFGQGLQPCHAGQVTVEAPTYSCSDVASFRLVDIDLNSDALTPQTATIRISSTTETDPELVLLTETGANTSIFSGTISTAAGPPVPDGVLQTRDGDVLTATYLDADDGTGRPATSFDTALLDCAGPSITNLRVESITQARATFSWQTEQAADSVVEWGLTPALGEVVSSGSPVTTHQLTASEFDSCGEVHFRVKSNDVFGNLSVADDNGQPFVFRANEIPGLYALHDFENGPEGWTLEGDWEIGAPQGIGGSSGTSDPQAAYNNIGVLGHDLSGQGAYPGDYEPGTTEVAGSPDHDATSWVNTKLILHRRLNAGVNDTAEMWLTVGAIGLPLYNSDGQAVTETAFTQLGLDISNQADGAPLVRLEFRQTADAAGNYSGWNIDDVIFKDGSLPDFAPCGGCGTGPAFAGATSAVDNDACGAGGVTVSWNPPPAWGTGGPGSYAVYRDLSPDFTPSGANRIASGVTGTSYTDLGAPTDQSLVYLVRAENDETCGGGPNNGGATDANQAYVSVAETSSRPTPDAVSGLALQVINYAHVRLSWDAVASAETYRIYRSTSPQAATFTLLAETAGLLYEDLDQGADPADYFYVVRAVNACGDEGP